MELIYSRRRGARRLQVLGISLAWGVKSRVERSGGGFGMDEDLFLHPNEQRSLVGPRVLGTPDLHPKDEDLFWGPGPGHPRFC